MNQYLPWYHIAWNGVWIVPAFVSLALFCFVMGCWQGPWKARQVWRDNV